MRHNQITAEGQKEITKALARLQAARPERPEITLDSIKVSRGFHAEVHRFFNAYALDSTARPRRDRGKRFDAGETMLFTRQLEFIQAHVLTVEFPDLILRDLVRPMAGIPEGAKSFGWRLREQMGRAREISNGADDLPNMTAKYAEQLVPIGMFGINHQYTVSEIIEAAYAGITLPTDLATDARESVERMIDCIGALGIDEDGNATPYGGLLNGVTAFGVTLQTKAADGYTGQFHDNGATGETMLVDLQKFCESLAVNSKRKAKANRLVVDNASFSRIATTPYSSLSDKTVLACLLDSNPSVREVIPWTACELADAQSNGPRWMAYDSSDPEAMGLINPVEYRTEPLQRDGLWLKVPGWCKFGGVVIKKPLKVTYLDGMRDEP